MSGLPLPFSRGSSSRRRHHLHRRRHGSHRPPRFQIILLFVAAGFAFYVFYTLFSSVLLSSGNSSQDLLAQGVSICRVYGRHGRLDYDGIDVSRHQGSIDWTKVGSDSCVRFVYIKATEGGDLKDSFYLRNVRQARSAGILVGSYHYFTSSSSVKEQFRNFYSLVDRRVQDLPPVIDVEDEALRGLSTTTLRHRLFELASLMELHYHVQPIIYCYAGFYNRHLWPHFNHYRLFVSHYSAAELPLAHGARPCIWQHSDRGIIDGVGCSVDLDVLAYGIALSDLRVVR